MKRLRWLISFLCLFGFCAELLDPSTAFVRDRKSPEISCSSETKEAKQKLEIGAFVASAHAGSVVKIDEILNLDRSFSRAEVPGIRNIPAIYLSRPIRPPIG